MLLTWDLPVPVDPTIAISRFGGLEIGIFQSLASIATVLLTFTYSERSIRMLISAGLLILHLFLQPI